jgi:hypothetical protein
VSDRRWPLLLAWLSVLVSVGLAVVGWGAKPDRLGLWLLVACFPPALWAFAEIAQGGEPGRERRAILDWHRSCVAWIGLMWLLSIGSQLAIALGFVDPGWRPFLRRAWWLAFGASVTLWGNLLPKLLSPWNVEDEPFDWQGVHRFVGWVVTLGGIGVILVWLSLEPAAAKTASRAILGVVFLLALGRKLVSLITRRPSAPPSGGLPAGDTSG